MILIDKPYVSNLFQKKIQESGIPLILTPAAVEIGFSPGLKTISEEDAVLQLKRYPDTAIYSSSENALDWVSKNLSFSRLPKLIELFKNKTLFRERTKRFFPDFFFKEVGFQELRDVALDTLPFPLVLKPSVGFFSLGVHIVNVAADWNATMDRLEEEYSQIQNMYPEAVLDATSFILEEYISGDEYAIDAYFNESGEPVILNITKHLFSSNDDVGDRVYITSKEVVESVHGPALSFLKQLAELESFVNFPLHFEVRLSPEKGLIPIEVNPLRFGAWCTTGDLTVHAWQFNPWKYFMQGLVPDWEELFRGKEDMVFSMILLSNTTGTHKSRISSFDYKKLLSLFAKPLEYRVIDQVAYPLFGFVFAETRMDKLGELEHILHSDLSEFITIAKEPD